MQISGEEFMQKWEDTVEEGIDELEAMKAELETIKAAFKAAADDKNG